MAITVKAKKVVKEAAPVVELPPRIEEYKDKPTLLLNPSSDWRFSFQMTKAKLILAHIDAIQKFVDSEGTEC